MFRLDMTKGPVAKSILLFTVPLLFSSIFQQLYNTVDTMIVGHLLGESALAAIGASSSVYSLLVGFALGVGNGMSIVTARRVGAGDEEGIRKTVAGTLVIGALLTLAVMIIGKWGLRPILQLLNTPAEILDQSLSYVSTLTAWVGVLFAYNLCAGLLRALGDSLMPLLFLILSSLLNIGLDVWFIRLMGVRGAAVATVLAQGISALLCLAYIACKRRVLVPRKGSFAVGRALYAELLGQGFSMGAMLALVSSGTVILQKAINGFGTLTIAGHITARKISEFGMMPCGAIASALSTFVSQNRGADKPDRILRGVKVGYVLSFGWAVLATLAMAAFARPLVGLLSGSAESVVLDNGSRYMLWSAPFYGVLGALLILRNGLQGLGQKMVPLISSFIELFGKIAFAHVLIPVLGYFGVILCEPIIWCFMCAQLLFSFYRNLYIRAHKWAKGA